MVDIDDMAIKKQNPHIKINEWMEKSLYAVKGWNITTMKEKHTFSSSCTFIINDRTEKK